MFGFVNFAYWSDDFRTDQPRLPMNHKNPTIPPTHKLEFAAIAEEACSNYKP